MRGERGSVSIVATGLMVMTVALAMGGTDVAKALIAQARAQTAADAAALAAAQELAIPSGLTPSDLAADYAERNDATLVSCTCEPGTAEAVVQVHVLVGQLLLFADDRIVTGRARAVVDLATS
jgi:secretion/DNA translocation related TadE-like protein